MSELRRVCVTGTPYEQGVGQGKAFRPLIEENVRFIREDLQKCKVNPQRYRDMTMRNAAFLEKDQPDCWQEMRGIADGAGLLFEDILTINVPTYFMKSYFSQECSMLLARGNATADGNTYLIKNRDMEMTVHQVSVEYRYADGSSVAEVGGAGIITYPAIGVSSAGLTVTSTGTSTGVPTGISSGLERSVSLDDFSRSNIFVNIHAMLRCCRTTQEAVRLLDSYPRMNGLNLIVADEQSAAVVETTKDAYRVQWADESGILYRTNHYCLGDYAAQNLTREAYPSTYYRYERIGEQLAQQRGKLRFQDLLRMFSDHKNSPANALCRHPNESAQTRTVSCSIVSLEDRELFTTPGNPCEHLTYSVL